ncbi:MAG: MerR family transcriptional regulator [Oscillospiraceae bacterium]
MKMLINEFAKLTNVSVRTLHYYDEIGLLPPAYIEEHNGYRFYDEKCLERMQEILFYRELDFSLKSILQILSSPMYDKTDALSKQRYMLKLKINRLEKLINTIDSAMKGENNMNFNVFDNSEYENTLKEYEKEAKEKWGDTKAYIESKEKTKNYSQEKYTEINKGMDNLIAEFSNCIKRGESPIDKNAQELVLKWKNFITENYYTCTDEILCGLGLMYVNDERFRKNIDKYGTGTAKFMLDAINQFCRKI